MHCKLKPGNPEERSRREFFREGVRAAAIAGLGALAGGVAVHNSSAANTLWQIDPHKCIYCGRCATSCVLQLSFLAPLKLDILKISEGPGVVNKVGGVRSASRAEWKIEVCGPCFNSVLRN